MIRKSSFNLDLELKNRVQEILATFNKNHPKRKKITITALLDSTFRLLNKDKKFRDRILKEVRKSQGS